MEDLIIKGSSAEEPTVELRANGRLSVSGTFMLENTAEYFKPVLSWMEDYERAPMYKTDMEFRVDYFNSAASMHLFKVLTMLEKIQANESTTVELVWKCKKGDESMLEAANSYCSMVELPSRIEEV